MSLFLDQSLTCCILRSFSPLHVVKEIPYEWCLDCAGPTVIMPECDSLRFTLLPLTKTNTHQTELPKGCGQEKNVQTNSDQSWVCKWLNLQGTGSISTAPEGMSVGITADMTVLQTGAEAPGVQLEQWVNITRQWAEILQEWLSITASDLVGKGFSSYQSCGDYFFCNLLERDPVTWH